MPRTLLVVLALIGSIVSVPARAADTATADLSGVYSCQGTNPDGEPYEGVVEIVKHHETYQLRWTFGSEVAAIGFGIRSGDVLAVTYFSDLPGIVAYKISEGTRLVGEWTVAGADGETFKETLVRTGNVGVPATPDDDSHTTRRPKSRYPVRVAVVQEMD